MSDVLSLNSVEKRAFKSYDAISMGTSSNDPEMDEALRQSLKELFDEYDVSTVDLPEDFLVDEIMIDAQIRAAEVVQGYELSPEQSDDIRIDYEELMNCELHTYEDFFDNFKNKYEGDKIDSLVEERRIKELQDPEYLAYLERNVKYDEIVRNDGDALFDSDYYANLDVDIEEFEGYNVEDLFTEEDGSERLAETLREREAIRREQSRKSVEAELNKPLDLDDDADLSAYSKKRERQLDMFRDEVRQELVNDSARVNTSDTDNISNMDNDLYTNGEVIKASDFEIINHIGTKLSKDDILDRIDDLNKSDYNNNDKLNDIDNNVDVKALFDVDNESEIEDDGPDF